MKINVALFGLGRIGIMHAQNLRMNKKFNLKYVFDINKKLSIRAAKKLKSTYIKNPNIAFKDKNIKVIFISSTTSTHIPLISLAAKHKKIIFCEKPLDLSIQSCLLYTSDAADE